MLRMRACQQPLLFRNDGDTVEPVKSPAELVDRFRSEGRKVTPQREAVFRVLHASPDHLTAEGVHAEVLRDLPMVSLRTVYQTLNDLTAMGELAHVKVGAGSARFDANLEPHHHLVCDDCGRVTDVAVDGPTGEVTAADDAGFEITRTEIIFRGRCPDCAMSGGVAEASDSIHPTEDPHNQGGARAHG